MKIGLLHYRVGETDGVSLEMEKWQTVLKNMGHEVFLIAGETGNTNALNIPSLAYRNRRNLILKSRIFEKNGEPEEEILSEINLMKKEIYSELDIIKDFDLIIVNNLFSLAHNIPAALALYDFCEHNKIKIIGHHHDFYWERDYYKTVNSKKVSEMLEKFFPPDNIKHVVINSIAEKSLFEKKQAESEIIPNVFDFDRDEWIQDDYNHEIYNILGINPENDIIFLQATRVVRRKGIEMAIDTVAEFNKKISEYTGRKTYSGKTVSEKTAVYIVLPGLEEEIDYSRELLKLAEKKGVNLKFCSAICSDEREDGKFSLWDFYTVSDFITYPSILEGFGNQFLEAVFAKKPILIYEYPVYKSDIAKTGFKTVSLGDNAFNKNGFFAVSENMYKKCSLEITELLFSEKTKDILNNNFEIGKKYYSYETLRKILEKNIRL
ncbi:MAG: glycosyltransferase family 4 protein [Thermotogae bacterium]|nr:glycosyltransferase family 4 protein [Thermotogota bacterium]